MLCPFDPHFRSKRLLKYLELGTAKAETAGSSCANGAVVFDEQIAVVFPAPDCHIALRGAQFS